MPGKDGKRKVVRKARVPRQPKPPAFPCTAGAWWSALEYAQRKALVGVSGRLLIGRNYPALSLWARRAVKRAYYAARANHQRGVSA